MNVAPLHELIEDAVQPVSQFWPMKGFVSHNPLQGLEHLPFDQAFREAEHLFGASGYLPLAEYRALYKSGRIPEACVDNALARLLPTDA
ncbi:MAG: putative inorganic carbon transporter subunit DabA, partial [Pseudomonadota bacterium]